MVDMFTPGKIGRLELPNRLVRSAVWEALADEQGFVTGMLVSRLRELAEGGVGLIISGYTYIQPNGKQGPGQTGIYTDQHIPGLQKLTSVVHQANGKISIQLVHVGPQTTKEMIGETPVGPSPVEHPRFGKPRELTGREIKQLVKDFGKAAARAVKAEFDAIQIHGAHGYLVSQFLSPRWNQRTDQYGGSLENRMRFATEVYEEVRRNAGDLPVFIKLNLDDLIEGSTTPEDALSLAQRLSQKGIDAIEVSAGGPASGKGPSRTKVKNEGDEGYYLELAKKTARVIDKKTCKIIAVGGFRSPAVINNALASGEIDFVALARPLIREPDLVNRWKAGDTSKAKCISCNRCFQTLDHGQGIQCMVELEKKQGEKK